MESQSEPLIDADHAAFLQGRVSIHVASTGNGLVPSQARAIGCSVSRDLQAVTLFISELQAPDLLADLLAGGPVAAVFNQPSSHRTVQLKAPGAQVRRLLDPEHELVKVYRAAFMDEVAPEGFSAEMIAAMLDCPEDRLVAVSFSPTAAFSQTPGPHAGEPLRRNP